jgi:GT2 family glycosyltransferase
VTVTPLLTVVIPTYQRRESLLRALASLRVQTLPPSAYEVIAAVDGSTDGTVQAVRSFPAPYTLSALEGPNRGRAAACNAGVRAATGALVVLLDDDMEATPGFLAAHAQAHEDATERAVVGAAPIVAAADSPPFVRYVAEGFRGRLERLARPGYKLRFRDAYTGNFSARREVLRAVGGFDEAFRVYGHEDYELALRLQAAGVELVYSAEACAHQHYEKTFAAFARDGIARGRTAVLFAEKHPAIVDRIKLSEYHSGPWPWRAARGLLLGLSRVTDRVPSWIVLAVARIERYEPARLHKCYTMAIDYLYWYGALGAMRERGNMTGLGTRVRVALLLILLYAGASTARWVHVAAARHARPGQDDISASDRRFRELRSALPAHGIVGYIGDPSLLQRGPDEAKAAALLHFRRYLLAQYALAPVLLTEGAGPELVVGNFDPGDSVAAPPGLHVFREFGDGIVLFRRTGP